MSFTSTYTENFIEWADVDVNRPNQPFCFTMDSIHPHKHPVILDMTEDAGHRVVFRAPYWSCDGAIEYVLNTSYVKLQTCKRKLSNAEDLVLEIDNIVYEMVARLIFLLLPF